MRQTCGERKLIRALPEHETEGGKAARHLLVEAHAEVVLHDRSGVVWNPHAPRVSVQPECTSLVTDSRLLSKTDGQLRSTWQR